MGGPVAAAAPVATATYAAAPVVAAHPATYAAAYAAAPAPITLAAAPATYAAAPVVTAVAPAAPISAGPVSSQFQAQDEFGNVAYGYQNINSAKQERGNALGGVTGSYTYADEAGVHTVNYIADDFGFRVAGDNLPVAPVYSGVSPVAPVYNGVAPLPVTDTLEVAAAKASFFEAFNAATKVKRSADADAHYNTYATAAYAPATYAAAPAFAAYAPATYSAAPAVAAYAPATYAAAPAVAAYAPAAYAAAPVAAAAPAREAVLTTIKLNPGHAVSYRVD